MKSEDEPVSLDETVLRIIWHEWFVTVPTTDPIPPILPRAFEPRNRKSRNPDLTGISVYRLACLPAPQEVLRLMTEDKQKMNGVVGLQVAALTPLGLSVEPDPIRPTADQPNPIPGHAIIPELRIEEYERHKAILLPKVLELAKLAAGDIRTLPEVVRWPEGNRTN